MPTRLPPGDPRSWRAYRSWRSFNARMQSAMPSTAYIKQIRVQTEVQIEKVTSLLHLLGPLAAGPDLEITVIGDAQLPLAARDDALSRLADRLVRVWKVRSREVKVALRQCAADSGCSVPAIKRQALRAAAWEVINHEIAVPRRSRLASDWLVDTTGHRVEAPPQDWDTRDARRWIISETIKMAEWWVLDTADAPERVEPLDVLDDAMLFRLSDDDDDDPGQWDEWREVVSDLASPAERELLSAMLTELEARDSTASIHGALSAAARALGIEESAARVRFSRLRARMRDVM